MKLTENIRTNLRAQYENLCKLCDDSEKKLSQYTNKNKTAEHMNDSEKKRASVGFAMLASVIVAAVVSAIAVMFAAPVAVIASVAAVAGLTAGAISFFNDIGSTKNVREIQGNSTKQKDIQDKLSTDITKEFTDQFDKTVDAIKAELEKSDSFVGKLREERANPQANIPSRQ